MAYSEHTKACRWKSASELPNDRECTCHRTPHPEKITKQDYERLANIVWVLIAIVIIGSLL